MNDIPTSRKWLSTPLQRGAFLLWIASSVLLVAYSLLPAPFAIVEQPALIRTAVDRPCARAIGGKDAEQVDRDLALLSYFANPYLLMVPEQQGGANRLPPKEYGIDYSGYVAIGAALKAGPVCVSVRNERQCTQVITDASFRRIVDECGGDAALYWPDFSPTIEWRFLRNLERTDKQWLAWTGWTWLLSTLVLLFGGFAVRIWRWVRFG